MIALLRMTAGLIAWAGVFSLVYALHGLGCAGGWDRITIAGASAHRLALIVAWLGGAALIALLAHALRGGRTFLDRSAVVIAWTGCIATLVGGLPILLVPACV